MTGNLLEVREFETITCNENYKDIPGFRYLDEKHFGELDRFIRDYTSTSDSPDILEFMKVGYRRNVGDIITLSSHVGIIELPGGFQIQVLPKIALGAEDGDNRRTKAIFLSMLRCLRDFEGKAFGSAALNASRMNLYEIFINMYLQEVQTLLKHGMKSDYCAAEDNLGFYKGRLMVSQHIRSNISHKERFYMQFDEYTLDRPENRLIKATLQKLMRQTKSHENYRRIQIMLGQFDSVKTSCNYEKDFAAVSTDRSMKDYVLLMQWSRIFLLNKSFTTFSGDKSGKALLFPMEQVFEAYVARNLKRYFEGQSGGIVTVSAQDSGYYLFDEPRKFKLRPDIVVRGSDGRTLIMDTKWKRLNTNERLNYGISQSDMYQMYAYAKKYDTSEIILLYPLNDDVRGMETVSFAAKGENEKPVTVRVHFVDLDSMDESIAGLYEACFG